MKRITVKEAAQRLSMTELAVRYLVETEKLDIGWCMRRPGSKRAVYYIYAEKVEKVAGNENNNSKEPDTWNGLELISRHRRSSIADRLSQGA